MSFDLDVCDKDRLVSGVRTFGSNAQLFKNVAGTGANNENVINIFFSMCVNDSNF
jgi:hypothetical protein